MTGIGFRFCVFAGSVLLPMTEEEEASVPRYIAFWLKPKSIFGLLVLTTFIHSSHLLTMPSTLALLRLMLAETRWPHGLRAPLTRTGYIVRAAFDGWLPHRLSS
jgi:hypothetical protein